ncbi:MAG: (4Fe-4S)-binding protein [Dehalococcoidia bacterium]
MTTAEPEEIRYEPAASRSYRTDRIEITWEPSLCIHFAACIRGSQAAFNPRRRPWVDATAETPDRLEEIVIQCPTGALHLLRHDGQPSREPEAPVSVTPQLDGPLFIRGPFEVSDRRGNVVRRDTRMALCRCGHSHNKPFCDDSHYRVGFESNDPAFGTEADEPAQ